MYAVPKILPYQDVYVKTTNPDVNLRNSIFCRVRYHHYHHKTEIEKHKTDHTINNHVKTWMFRL